VQGLQGCLNLESLLLSRNQITAKAIACLKPLLNAPFRIQTLDLDNNELRAEGAALLVESCIPSQTLTSLQVVDNLIGDQGAESMAQYLCRSSCLVFLDLRDNLMSSLAACIVRQAALRRWSRGVFQGRVLLESGDASTPGLVDPGPTVREDWWTTTL